MRKLLILSALVGGTALGTLGCKSTRGRCDCGYDPANAQLQQPSNPYPTTGPKMTADMPSTMPAPSTPPAKTPALAPLPMSTTPMVK